VCPAKTEAGRPPLWRFQSVLIYQTCCQDQEMSPESGSLVAKLFYAPEFRMSHQLIFFSLKVSSRMPKKYF